MATGNEVFGRCVGEIDVSVEIKNVVVWLCCWWNYLGFMLGREGGSRLTKVGDGARYWRRVLMLWV